MTSEAQTAGEQLLPSMLPTLEAHERIELRAKLLRGVVVQRWTRSVKDMLAVAMGMGRYADVWFAPALRDGEYGGAAHVTRLQSLWCDVDAKCFRGGKQEAYEAIRGLPLPPTLLVDTGGGFHPYWLLAQPIAASDLGSHARQAMKGVRLSLNNRANARLDPVDDLSRVLRLPGSWNSKYDPPTRVAVIESNLRLTYTLEDFRRAGLWEPSPIPPTPAAVRVRPLTPPRAFPRWVQEALSYPDRFIRHSPSELDFAVVCRLLDAVGPKEAEAIWLSSQLGAREKVQDRPDYRERTIRAALTTVPEKSVPPAVLRIRVE